MAKRSSKSSGGGQGVALLLLLVLLAVGTTWNYRRNVAAENTQPRPYRSYSDADLDALIHAYRGEIDGLKTRYEKASGHKIQARDQGYLGDQIQEFERVRHASEAVRAIGFQVAEREGMLRALEKERKARAGDSHGWKLLLRRAFTIRL